MNSSRFLFMHGHNNLNQHYKLYNLIHEAPQPLFISCFCHSLVICICDCRCSNYIEHVHFTEHTKIDLIGQYIVKTITKS